MIYITTILMLNCMGIGYGVWSENLNLDVGISTGFIKPEVYIHSDQITADDGNLTLTLSDDHHTLNIDGWVYPSFYESIPIKIKDMGSIPVALSNIDVSSSGIVDLEEDNTRSRLSSRSSTHEDTIESFTINISPNENANTRMFSLGYEQSSDDIQELIDRLDTVEYHKFTYKLEFEQEAK